MPKMQFGEVSQDVLLLALGVGIAVLPFLNNYDSYISILTMTVVVLLAGIWFSLRLVRGYAPINIESMQVGLIFLALTYVSYLLSPVKFLTADGLRFVAMGLLVFVLGSSINTNQRKIIYRIIFVAGYILCFTAFSRMIAVGYEPGRFSSFFDNPNMFAAYLVMLILMAIAMRWWKSALIFLVTLGFTACKGGFFALGITGAIFLLTRKPLYEKIAGGLILLALALLFFQTDLVRFSDRFVWWETAFEMIRARPFLGFGPGSFGYVYTKFHLPEDGVLSSIYAHSWFLEFAVELGLIFAALFTIWLVWRITTTSPMSRYAILAVSIMCLQDFGLSITANYVLFWFLLSDKPQANKQVYFSGGTWLGVAAVCVVTLSLVSSGVSEALLRHEINQSVKMYNEGREKSAITKADEIVAKHPNDLFAMMNSAEMKFNYALSAENKNYLIYSAVDYHRVLILNPYSSTAYDKLINIFTLMENEQLKNVMAEKKCKYIKC